MGVHTITSIPFKHGHTELWSVFHLSRGTSGTTLILGMSILDLMALIYTNFPSSWEGVWGGGIDPRSLSNNKSYFLFLVQS